jgi:hypothetical protein
MGARTLTDWDFWKGRVLSQGETLAKEYGGNVLPISLKRIANVRKVRAVVFRPLLVDGCLTIIDDGFKIYIRCKKHQADEVRARFESECEIGPLPQRMRFTVAHEIAHTLFYDLSHGRPKHRLNVEHQKRLETLERVCNKVAARILLPTDLLREELKKSDPFDPSTLRRIAEKAAVSGPMLVNRIKEIGVLVKEAGIVAYVEPDVGAFAIKAVGVPRVLRSIFPAADIGVPFSSLCPRKDCFLNGGNAFDLDFDVKCETQFSKGVQKFHLQCEGQQSRAQHRGLFVTARRTGNPAFG